MTAPYLGIPILAAVVIAEAVVSQVPEPWWQSIMQTGAIGGVLIYFMFWGQKIIRDLTRSVNLLANSISTMILHAKHQDAAISELALELQKKTEDELKRGSKPSAN